MKNLSTSILVASVSLAMAALAQERDAAIPVSLIEILANWARFDGKKVDVTGFLVMEREPNHRSKSNLFLHQEDAKYFLGNAVIIIPSNQMVKDEEKINNMYVRLTGRVRVTPTTSGSPLVGITDIERCVRWPPTELRK